MKENNINITEVERAVIVISKDIDYLKTGFLKLEKKLDDSILEIKNTLKEEYVRKTDLQSLIGMRSAISRIIWIVLGSLITLGFGILLKTS